MQERLCHEGLHEGSLTAETTENELCQMCPTLEHKKSKKVSADGTTDVY